MARAGFAVLHILMTGTMKRAETTTSLFVANICNKEKNESSLLKG